MPGHADCINSGGTHDWRATQNDNLWQGVNGINNPCPSGYRIPTGPELLAERSSGGAFLASPLKWSQSGIRSDGGSIYNAIRSYVWSSEVSSSFAKSSYNTSATLSNSKRQYSMSVRCIKHY